MTGNNTVELNFQDVEIKGSIQVGWITHKNICSPVIEVQQVNLSSNVPLQIIEDKMLAQTTSTKAIISHNEIDRSFNFRVVAVSNHSICSDNQSQLTLYRLDGMFCAIL